DAIRRTVSDRVIPPPVRRRMVPSNTWTRSRVPSTTLALTLTVSPGARVGMSVRIWSLTISSSTFTGSTPAALGGRDGPASRVPGHGWPVADGRPTAEYSMGRSPSRDPGSVVRGLAGPLARVVLGTFVD